MTKSIQENISRLVRSIGSGWDGSPIFIIGKGPSLDELSGFTLPNGLVININDSEKIIQGHLGIFSGNWVRHSLKERGFKCSFYLAGKPLPADVPHEVLPAIPLEYDDEDLTTYRLGMEEFFDENFVLTNALKACMAIARISGKQPVVYLLGFDFSTEKGEVSKSLGVDYARSDIDRNLVVHSQESSYLQFVKYFEDNPLIKLAHVGVKEYSELTPTQFRDDLTTPSARISKPTLASVSAPPVEVPAKPLADRVLIVAELTNNHLGDKDRLVEMVERAKAAGADLIKIQKREVDSFYSEEKLSGYYWSPFGKTLGDYRRGVELDLPKLELLDTVCKKLSIEWFCSVLDFPSFEVIREFSPSLVKIPSTISNHHDFHAQMAEAYQGAIVISTGYTDESYEDYILKTFRRNEKIYLLHCISAYPTALNDCNVAVVRHYSELSRKHPAVIPGYSSHDLGSLASVLAVANGARMIEKHVKLGDVEWVHFDKVALDLKTDSFRRFVHEVRNAEAALGSPQKRILSSEHHKYEVVKPSKKIVP